MRCMIQSKFALCSTRGRISGGGKEMSAYANPFWKGFETDWESKEWAFSRTYSTDQLEKEAIEHYTKGFGFNENDPIRRKMAISRHWSEAQISIERSMKGQT